LKKDLIKLQGFVTLLLIFTSIFRLFIIRERRHFGLKARTLLIIISILATIGILLVGSFGIIISSLNINYIFFVLGMSLIFSLISDFPKYLIFGILVAPKSGKETRNDLMEKGERIMEMGKESVSDVVGKTKDLAEFGKKKVEELKAAVK